MGSATRESTARTVAVDVLRRVRESDAWANLSLPGALERAGLAPREAGLATELTYGTLRRLGTLDWVIGLHADRPIADLDPPVLDALRLGTYQLLYADRIPDHAAVSETVGLLRRKGARGFCNAVLRRISAERHAIPWPTREGDLATYLRIHHAHPEWLVRLWLRELGAGETEALCESDNRFPGVGVRVEPGADDLRERFREAGLDVEPGRWSPQALLVRGGGDPTTWPGWDAGAFAVQDEGSVLAGAALAPQPGEVVCDLCAGPGGKTGQLAAGTDHLVAVELHGQRAELVRRTLDRFGRSCYVVRGDGRRPPVRDGLDAVLLDAPCSGLGVLRRRPEARWRVGPADVEASAALQWELVESAFELLRPGGRLVYAVCTVTRAETVDLVDRFLASREEATPEPVLPDVPRAAWTRGRPDLQLLPHMHGTDGMYVAVLGKRRR